MDTPDPWDDVTVPLPFTDRPEVKLRPALVLSMRAFNEHGHTVMAMITSASGRGQEMFCSITRRRGCRSRVSRG